MTRVAELALAEGRQTGATRIVPPTPFAPLAVGGGWAAGVPVLQFSVDAKGVVTLKGQISGGAVPANVATLDPDFRPAADTILTAQSTDTAGPTFAPTTVRIIAATGVMSVENGIASIDNINFDGLQFSVF